MVSCINEVTVESRRSPFTSYPSNDVSFHFRTPAGLIQRGEGRRADTPPYSSKGTNEQSSVSCELKAYLFQAPESINACIILWIQLFSPAKWLGHPCMKPISNFQSETHPGTTYRSSKSHLPLATVWRTGAVEHVVQICLCAFAYSDENTWGHAGMFYFIRVIFNLLSICSCSERAVEYWQEDKLWH